MSKRLKIALAGNPNSGKSTVFNNLTGAHQHVGNYPGVTVEKKEGSLRYKNYEIAVVDLPGIYSLTAYSLDEIVARNFILEERPDVVVDVVDSSNMERNLYLACQFVEIGIPLILVFNMYDMAQKQGIEINREKISGILGVPVVFTVATRKTGMDRLLEEIINVAEKKDIRQKSHIDYGPELEKEIKNVKDSIEKDKVMIQRYPSRWLAVKLIENDGETLKKIKGSPYSSEILEQIKKSSSHLQEVFGDTPEAIIADRRYGFIGDAVFKSTKRISEVRQTTSDIIDKVLINRVFGLPIFLILMWLLFKIVFRVSEPLMGWVEAGQEWLGTVLGGFFREGGAIQSLVVDGIIGGVGSVFVFIPIIFLLFLAISILEDSGYMARASFIMDKVMSKIGLHGRSFIPMLLGFGCNLPAIMATRTIEDRKDRLITILVNPFMSCGARLPVYTLFISAFFSEGLAGNILFSLYTLGIVVAVIMAKVFRIFLFKGTAAPFVMELPPYRIPTIKGVLIHMWERGAVYLKKAGTIIFAGCILVWFLSNFPWNVQYSKNYNLLVEQAGDNEELVESLENQKAYEKLEKSYAGKLGKAIAPVFKPLGFDEWRVSVGLVGGFIAKEIVVGTLGTLHSIGEADEESEGLRQTLQRQRRPDGSRMFTPLVAYSLMVFVLLYIPCIATVAVIKRETNSWRWPVFTVLYTTAVAWLVSFIIYQVGRFLGLG
jgi:ferrous iron transport protein B